eukprot:gene16677-biopygen14340
MGAGESSPVFQRVYREPFCATLGARLADTRFPAVSQRIVELQSFTRGGRGAQLHSVSLRMCCVATACPNGAAECPASFPVCDNGVCTTADPTQTFVMGGLGVPTPPCAGKMPLRGNFPGSWDSIESSLRKESFLEATS